MGFNWELTFITLKCSPSELLSSGVSPPWPLQTLLGLQWIDFTRSFAKSHGIRYCQAAVIRQSRNTPSVLSVFPFLLFLPWQGKKVAEWAWKEETVAVAGGNVAVGEGCWVIRMWCFSQSRKLLLWMKYHLSHWFNVVIVSLVCGLFQSSSSSNRSIAQREE